ncbi:hypothetical protein C8R44DRAFT_848030 [Mycena epipterygia]|nr:hypothetical protein C8R44DRAFT_848030 [Mycena epipterygia]
MYWIARALPWPQDRVLHPGTPPNADLQGHRKTQSASSSRQHLDLPGHPTTRLGSGDSSLCIWHEYIPISLGGAHYGWVRQRTQVPPLADYAHNRTIGIAFLLKNGRSSRVASRLRDRKAVLWVAGARFTDGKLARFCIQSCIIHPARLGVPFSAVGHAPAVSDGSLPPLMATRNVRSRFASPRRPGYSVTPRRPLRAQGFRSSTGSVTTDPLQVHLCAPTAPSICLTRLGMGPVGDGHTAAGGGLGAAFIWIAEAACRARRVVLLYTASGSSSSTLSPLLVLALPHITRGSRREVIALGRNTVAPVGLCSRDARRGQGTQGLHTHEWARWRMTQEVTLRKLNRVPHMFILLIVPGVRAMPKML